MDGLREKIAAAIRQHLNWPDSENLTPEIADSILAIPEIVDAVALRRTALSRYAKAVAQAEPSDAWWYQNASPLAVFLKPEDCEP